VVGVVASSRAGAERWSLDARSFGRPDADEFTRTSVQQREASTLRGAASAGWAISRKTYSARVIYTVQFLATAVATKPVERDAVAFRTSRIESSIGETPERTLSDWATNLWRYSRLPCSEVLTDRAKHLSSRPYVYDKSLGCPFVSALSRSAGKAVEQR